MKIAVVNSRTCSVGGRGRERGRESAKEEDGGGILMMSKSNRIDHPILLKNTAGRRRKGGMIC